MTRVLALQNCAIEGFGHYARRLVASGAELVLVRAWQDEPLPPLDSVQAILVQGTPIPVYAEKPPAFLQAEFAYLSCALERGVPCLGICGGAQALALLLGAGVWRHRRLEIGARVLRLTAAGRADPLLRDFPDRFPAIEWHGDTFDLPPGARLLVEGDDCPNQMFRRGDAIGLQFHLESDVADVAVWAEAYAGELAACGRTEDEVVAECRAVEATTEPLARSLMARFIEVIAGAAGRSGPPAGDRRDLATS